MKTVKGFSSSFYDECSRKLLLKGWKYDRSRSNTPVSYNLKPVSVLFWIFCSELDYFGYFARFHFQFISWSWFGVQMHSLTRIMNRKERNSEMDSIIIFYLFYPQHLLFSIHSIFSMKISLHQMMANRFSSKIMGFGETN